MWWKFIPYRAAKYSAQDEGGRAAARLDTGLLMLALQPLHLAQIAVQPDAYDGHDADQDEIAVAAAEFRHVVEVHPVPARDQRRRRQQGSPTGELLDDFPLRDRNQRQVDTHRRGEHFAHGVGRFVDAQRMVEDIAEVGADFLRDQLGVHAGELRQDVLHRRNGQAQLRQFALELVELDDRLALVGLGEDVLLELVELL